MKSAIGVKNATVYVFYFIHAMLHTLFKACHIFDCLSENLPSLHLPVF